MKAEPRYVDKGVETHVHLDEAFAIRRSLIEGKDIYLGLDKVVNLDAFSHFHRKQGDPEPLLKFVKRYTYNKKADWIKARKIAFGGGGDIDEHTSGIRARKEGGSSIAEIIRECDIKDPDVLKIVAEISYFDRNSGSLKTHWGKILKIVQLGFPGFQLSALKTSFEIFDAVIAQMKMNRGRVNGEVSFKRMFRRLISEHYPQKGNRRGSFKRRIRRGLIKSMVEDEDKFLLGMTNIVQALFRNSTIVDARKRYRDVMDAIRFIFNVLEKDQTNYELALDQFRERMPNGYFQLRDEYSFRVGVYDEEREKNKGKGILCGYAVTNNPQAHSALRTLQARITIVMTPIVRDKSGKRISGGNVTIQGDQKWAEKCGWMKALNDGMSNLVAMLRYSDMAESVRCNKMWSLLSMRGNCPGDIYWYLGDDEWLFIANGTHMHDVEPTRLTMKSIVHIARHAFDPVMTTEWQKDRNVLDLAITNAIFGSQAKTVMARRDR